MQYLSTRGFLGILLSVLLVVSWGISTSAARSHQDNAHKEVFETTFVLTSCSGCTEEAEHVPVALCFSACMHLAPATKFLAISPGSVSAHGALPVDDAASMHRIVSPEPHPPKVAEHV